MWATACKPRFGSRYYRFMKSDVFIYTRYCVFALLQGLHRPNIVQHRTGKNLGGFQTPTLKL